jgi:hypothetical protein
MGSIWRNNDMTKFKVGDRCKVVNPIVLALHPNEVEKATVTIKEPGEKFEEWYAGEGLGYKYEVNVDLDDGKPFPQTAFENELEKLND